MEGGGTSWQVIESHALPLDLLWLWGRKKNVNQGSEELGRLAKITAFGRRGAWELVWPETHKVIDTDRHFDLSNVLCVRFTESLMSLKEAERGEGYK